MRENWATWNAVQLFPFKAIQWKCKPSQQMDLPWISWALVVHRAPSWTFQVQIRSVHCSQWFQGETRNYLRSNRTFGDSLLLVQPGKIITQLFIFNAVKNTYRNWVIVLNIAVAQISFFENCFPLVHEKSRNTCILIFFI